jgi:hypothetical protein
VRPVSEVSADGIHFPVEQNAFLDEVLLQGAELYAGRAGLTMDVPLLRSALSRGTPGKKDDADFCSLMRHRLGAGPPSVGSPVRASDLAGALERGSAACALDELPRYFLAHAGPHGLGALAALLSGGALRDTLLGAVLHIALVKKEPAWLMRNSRPVLLEPCLRRAEATIQFRRLMHGVEMRGALPPEMFAYRAQLPGHWAPLLLRWLIVWWAGQGI